MKKITIILALLFVGLIQAQPQITFEQEIIDYGRIEKGSDGVRIFKFTNTGNETLIIDTNMMVKSLF